MNHTKFFNAAYAVALAGPGAGGKGHNRFRLGAVIVDAHRIVAARYNCMKTHPKLIKYFTWPFCHAEAHAIVSLGLDNCAGKNLYVVRLLRNNELALAKPCSSCMALIVSVGISSIHYSTNNGYGEIRLLGQQGKA